MFSLHKSYIRRKQQHSKGHKTCHTNIRAKNGHWVRSRSYINSMVRIRHTVEQNCQQTQSPIFVSSITLFRSNSNHGFYAYGTNKKNFNHLRFDAFPQQNCNSINKRPIQNILLIWRCLIILFRNEMILQQ